ncbi:MAG TPA: glycosyltransferase family 2 protein [Candidatus Dormibacteraeota bacterium]|nr:glycosyltransferase family 2 protein [Candidatus Dormibacteraeota bacterium]
MTPSLAIVIPAHNEAGRIRSVLADIPQEMAGIGRIVRIVIDDGSTDGTGAAAKHGGAVVLRHRVNLGVGAALHTGTEAAIRLGADIIVHMDADGQHPPADLPRLVQPLLDGDVATSAIRQFARPMPWLFIFGNRFLALVTRGLFALDNPDTQCAYRAFWARAWPDLRWQSSDYAFASEMLVRSHRGGIRWTLVPIQTVYHDRYKGTGISDGIRILRKLVTWRLTP